MSNFGIAVLFFGILVALAGIGGFFDTRKVDRRFKTGYKDNAPDNRDFGRSGKHLLYGVGISIVGAAIISLSSPSSSQSAATASQSESSASTAAPASDATPVVSNRVELDPNATAPKPDSGVALGANERVVSQASEATPDPASSEKESVTVDQTAAVSPEIINAKCVDDGTYFGANVCKSATLAAAYELELKEYDAAQARIGGKDAGVGVEQQIWLDKVTKSCEDMECLSKAFDARVTDLHLRYRKDS